MSFLYISSGRHAGLHARDRWLFIGQVLFIHLPKLSKLLSKLQSLVSVLWMNLSSNTATVMFVDAAGGAMRIRAFQHTLQSATQTRPVALQSAHQLDHSGFDNLTITFIFLYVWNNTACSKLLSETNQLWKGLIK